jgi:predicted dehydrogenase
MPLGVAIIGAGLIGFKRAAVINKVPGCRLVATVDLNESAARRLAAQWGGDFGKESDGTVRREDVDIVVVSATNDASAAISMEALRNGKNVLCEKPMGRSVEESEKIMNAARGKGVVVKVGFNHRHHPAIFKAKELVQKGEIGPIYSIRCRYGHGGRPGYDQEWRARREISGGGELLDQGVHIADLFRWFLGDFEEAFGYTPTYFWDMKVEDNAFAMFRTQKNQVAMMHTSWTQWKNLFSFEVFGESGYVIVEGLGGSYGMETLKIGKRKKELKNRKTENENHKIINDHAISDLCSSYLGGPPDEEIIEFPGPDISWEMEWREFISAIREGRSPLGNGQDGLEANRMIEAVYRSTRENRPVKIG